MHRKELQYLFLLVSKQWFVQSVIFLFFCHYCRIDFKNHKSVGDHHVSNIKEGNILNYFWDSKFVSLFPSEDRNKKIH